MSEYPISCITCRKRKIKCNKKKPCNQCIRKGIVCEFPSKFRNINIPDEAHGHEYAHDYYHPHNRNSGSNSNSPKDFSRLHDEVELLREEKLSILHENFKLSQKNNELRSKLQALDRTSNTEHDDEHGIEIAGETTELGEKYYGPSSSNYMIETLRQKSAPEEAPRKLDLATPNPKKSNPSEDADMDKSDCVLQKKPLPWLLHENATQQENVACIKYLILRFFEHTAYRSFILRPVIFDFVEHYDKISDKDWENDDDLLLLHMILVLAVLRLTPKTYADSGLDLKPIDSMAGLQKRTSKLIANVLFRGFTRLRHNLLNESIMTVQAYILCTEYYFIDQRYEESWSMLFHCCAVAFAIGLHVMVNLRTTNESLEEAPVKLAEMSQRDDLNDEAPDGGVKVEDSDSVSEEEENNGDVPRFKVWFALKYMCGQLCSILGRPNPLSIQVNSVVLFSLNENNLHKIRLDSKKTQVQLKMGLSECLRLSNMMLIESFMINFTINDVLKLDARFKEECEKLAWFVSGDYQSQQNTLADTVDEVCHMPMAVEKEPALIDLIILHINRAKLMEPFSNQFLDPNDAKYLMDSMCELVLKFLDYQYEFIQDFLKRIMPQIKRDGHVFSKIKLGKVFRVHYPFLNLFMYQGIIVIFTLLNYKAKEFVQLPDESFLRHCEQKLNELLQLLSRLTDEVGEDVRLWSTNIMYLINKDLQHINTLLGKRSSEQNQQNNEINFDNDEDLDKLLGVSFKDPFWLNAENIPYYLSSPSDDGFGGGMFEEEPYNKEVQEQPQMEQQMPMRPQYPPNPNQFDTIWNHQRAPLQNNQFRQLQQPLPLTTTSRPSLFLLLRQPAYHHPPRPDPPLALGSQEPLPIPQVPMDGHPNVTRIAHLQQPMPPMPDGRIQQYGGSEQPEKEDEDRLYQPMSNQFYQ